MNDFVELFLHKSLYFWLNALVDNCLH
jgi:hypothetical protein